MIAIINHGQCNLGSLTNTLRNLNFSHEIWSDNNESHKLSSDDGFILPGVGSFNAGMRALRKSGLDKVVNDLIDDNIKGLGICLGMQMLCELSEEGNYKEHGLGIFKGKLKKLSTNAGKVKVPNMGWNYTTSTKSIKSSGIAKANLNQSFYYLHSYALMAETQEDVVASFKHGIEDIPAAIYKGSILGVQFHPEKSQIAGLTLLKNYFS